MTVSDDLLPFDGVLLEPSQFRPEEDEDEEEQVTVAVVVGLLETLPFDGNCLRLGVKRFI